MICIYKNGFKGARKLPASAVEMNCPFAIILSPRLGEIYMMYYDIYAIIPTYQPYNVVDNI